MAKDEEWSLSLIDLIERRGLIQNQIQYKEMHTNWGQDRKSKIGVWKGETRFLIPNIGIKKNDKKIASVKENSYFWFSTLGSKSRDKST